MRINQRQFRNNIFETLIDIKSIDNGNEHTIGFCKETDMFYKWENDGGLHIPDDYFILTTGKGGNTRWIQITVSKEYVDLLTEGYYLDFEKEDWVLDSDISLKFLEISHNMDTVSPNIDIFHNNKLIFVHEIEIINNNKVKIFTTDTEEFSGCLLITK